MITCDSTGVTLSTLVDEPDRRMILGFFPPPREKTMPIKFRCPNPDCGKPLTVSDGAAGRAGKCPGCGGDLVVPRPEAEVEAEDYGLELIPEPEVAPIGAPTPRTVKPSQPASDPDWSPVDDAVGIGEGSAISFDAIGLAWGLVQKQLGTWILAVLAVVIIQAGTLVLVNVLAFFAGAIAAAIFGPLALLTTLAAMLVGITTQAVLTGGLYKMALKQIDGGEIRVGDVFDVKDAAPGLVVAGLLTGIGTILGMVFLIIPGLVFASLAIFTVPLVLEGFAPVDAIKRSFQTLGRDWLSAILFVFVASLILMAGGIAFGLGTLVTLPIFVLAIAVQYRRSFAPGGLTRKSVVADPWAEAVGEKPRVSGGGRIPVWAWGLLGLGFVVPVALVCVVIAVALPAARKAAQLAVARDKNQRQANDFQADMKNGQRLPGFNPGPPPINRGANLAPGGVALEPLEQALDDLKQGGNRRVIGARALVDLPLDEARQAEVMAALAPLIRQRGIGDDAALAVEKWAGPGDIPTLIDGLGVTEARTRLPLIRALGRLKAEAAIPVLVEHVKIREDRGEAVKALRAIGPNVVPEVKKLLTNEDRDVRRESAAIVRTFAGKDPSTQMALALAGLSSPGSFERERALEDVARIPADDASRAEVLAAVLPLLKDKEGGVRRSAVKVLEVWGTVEQIPDLFDMMGDTDRSTRLNAISALRHLNDTASALALAKVLDIPEIRKEAAEALIAMKLQDDELEAQVLKALANDDATTRQVACQVLRVIGTNNSVPALRRAMGDENRSVASAARNALNTIEGAGRPSARPTPKKR